MGRQRGVAGRRRTAEFKMQAVRMMRERLASGVTLQRVSEELDVHPDQLRVWAKQVESAPDDLAPSEIFPGHGHKRLVDSPGKPAARQRVLTQDEEIERLRRENERLRQERDFLKKAAAFFAKESR